MHHSLFLLTLPLATVFSLTYFAVAKAQITPDNTLGAQNSRVTQDVIKGIPSDRIDGGAIRGTNLFHSFQEFNINAGRGAYFSNPVGITNILTRVTGDNVSNIQGIFGVLGKANLFFINPNGIIFGANARLDVGGSFLGSTANSLIFENGFEFSATNPQAPPLLTITAPIELSYRENFKNITNQSRAVDDSGNLVGLTVPEGNLLALVGGNVNLDGGRLRVPGGRVELGGLSAAGTIGLNGDGSLSFPVGVQRADVSLTNGATVDVSSNGGGSIAVNARNLQMTGRSYLQAGIGQGLGTVGTQAGDISVNATGAINLNNSQIANNVQSGANGQGGDVSISTSSLQLEAGAQVAARTFGAGKGGSLSVEAQDVQLIGTSADGQFFSGLAASAQPNSTGDAGILTIRTNTLLARDGARVFTGTFGRGKGGSLRVEAQDVQLIGTSADGQFLSGLAASAQPNSTGDAGDLTLKTNTLLVRDGAVVFTGTFGRGKGGNLRVDAQDVQLIGTSVDGQAISSLAASTQPNSTGDAGNLTLKTNTLLARDGAVVFTGTLGAGKGGSLSIDAQDVQLIGRNANGPFFSGLAASAQPNSTGDAGDLTLKTNTLLARDGARVFTGTYGAGKGGNLRVDAQDVQLIGTSADGQFLSGLAASAQPNSTGNAGDLTLKTNTLLVRDGAVVFTGTFGRGKGGNLRVDAQDVQLIGTSVDGQAISSLAASTQPNSTGDAGNLTLKTNTLLVRDGAVVFTGTLGAGKGGSLSIEAQDVQLIGRNANSPFGSGLAASAQPNSTGDAGDLTIRTNTLLARDGAEVFTGTFGRGKGGSLRVDAQDVQLIGMSANDQFFTGLAASAQPNSTGNAGDLTVTANTLRVRDGAGVAVESLGRGTAGNLSVNARSIRLDNNGTLSANTRSNSTNPNLEQATITLQSGDLILSRGSNITTNARGSNVIGGNIKIDTNVLAAVENSFISANSTNFRGGQVKINTQGLFRSSDSEITATGANSQLNGTVQINTPDIDPNRSLITLPTVTEVAPRLVSSSCAAFADVGGSNFAVTGRSGLPPSPDEPLTSDVVWSDTRLPATTVQHQRKTHAAKPKTQSIAIVPATGWVLNDKGEVTLISSVSNSTSMSTPTNCPAK